MCSVKCVRYEYSNEIFKIGYCENAIFISKLIYRNEGINCEIDF